MALLSIETVQTIFAAALPWSAAHANEGRLVPLTKEEFSDGGYYGLFKVGDFVFMQTREPDSDVVKPAIYAVKQVREWSARENFEIYWELRLIGGYGAPEINLFYQNPYGQQPHVYVESWFPDLGHGTLPKLNYYTLKVVRGGKTVWDVKDRLKGP